ncbi:type VII secretion integral membrane protein EccD [Streptomyces mirabilis]|uniref:type VII secretion integral membrane protein EccD n=1 Tax=Streptomyces mirabilis TaxID=68239 RepID=UPI00331F98ED
MIESSVNGLCRLTVRAPDKTLDLAVPADIPVADLLPVIAAHAGETEEAGPEHDGWVLQRIGGEPLDAEETPASLKIKDGETLLLRPRDQALPPIRFDNLVDAVSAAARGLPHGWTPQVSGWTLRLMTAAALTGCLALLAVGGASAGDRSALSAGAAVLALAGAGAAGRVLEDRPGGVVLGLYGAAFLALFGSLLVAPVHSEPTARATGACLLAAGAAATLGMVLANSAVAGYPVVFGAGGVVALAGVLGGGLMIALDEGFSQVAAAVALCVVVCGAFVPMMAFSLAGLKLPPLPTNAEQLQEGIEPRSHTDVAQGGAAVDTWMTGLYAAVGAVCGVCLLGLAADPGLPQVVTAALLALLLGLHSRSLGTSWQRLALAVPAGLGAVLLAVETARRHGPSAELLSVAGLLVAAALASVASWAVPGRRLLPHWGRAADILQSVTAVALFPTILWTLGIYQRLRGLNG